MRSEGFLAITGNYELAVEMRETAVLQALREAVEFGTNTVKDDWRKEVTKAGLGNRLPKTIRGEVFPARGLSWRTAGFVASRAEHIISAFSKGETVRSAGGGKLAVPIPGSGADKLRPIDDGSGRRSHIAAAKRRFGDRLFVVPALRGRPAMIALKGGSVSVKTGRVGARKRLKSGRFGAGAQTVFLFWLLPQIRLQKRLDMARIANRGQRRFANRVAFYLSRRLAEVQ